MPTPSLKRSATRRKIKSIWLPADHSDERPFSDYPLQWFSLPSCLPSFSFFPLLGYLFFFSFSLSFFRTTSRSLTAPLNTGTAIKANKSNERLVFSAVLQRNITEIYEIAKRRDLKIARDVLRGKAVETHTDAVLPEISSLLLFEVYGVWLYSNSIHCYSEVHVTMLSS